MSSAPTEATPRPDGALRHEALLYGSDKEYVTGVVAFLHGAMVAAEPALVAVPGPHVELLRGSVNGAGDSVRFVDMIQLGRNPSRIIPAIGQFLDEHAGRSVRFVGEPIWPGRSDAGIIEATRHEALINTAFVQADVRVLCPYDIAGLDAAVLTDARRTHPEIIEGGVWRRSSRFTDPTLVHDAAAWPRLAPPDTAVAIEFDDPAALPALRSVARQQATAAGLADHRVEDLLLAISEVATNTLVHTPGGGTLRVWPQPGSLVCEVHDSGRIIDPLAGRQRPATHALGGRGLWLINHLCDLVEIRSGHDGTTVRCHMSR